MDIEKILAELTSEEKAALVAGTDFMYTNPVPRLGIPSLRMSDGPHGLRIQKAGGDNGVTESDPATAFPTAAATASSWNPENTRRMGEAIAEECRHYGVHVVLGPGVNLKRDPLCGRNFEYFSEDPYLASEMAIAEIEGLKSRGIGASVKHFALNNSENYRFMGNSAVSENTMRKLYLKQFKRIVKKAKPASLMCAYNRINGTYCSENKWLLTDLLRKEWGFEGLVMTDWGAMRDRKESLRAGLDLEMPGDTAICRKWILDGLRDGSLAQEDLDRAVRNVLKFVDSYAKPAGESPARFDEHHVLSCEIAADSAVLLQNEGVLPLKEGTKVHIAGPLFETMRYQGAGSSMIHPALLTTPKDAFEARGVTSVPVEECDVILVFAGLTDEYESEGSDRTDMRLPEDQLRLIEDLTGTGKPVAVVLFGGSPVELPFAEDVNAILDMYLPGQNGGTAAYMLLFGEKNPSGKLAETWPLRYEDVPTHKSFGKGVNEVYAEGTEIGYRYYGKHGIPVRFPFGHGLSYTTFEKSEWEKSGESWSQRITNTGDRFGAEVAQLYLDGELRGFRKVYLAPGESTVVTVTPEPEDDRTYPDELAVPGEPPALPLTLESRFSDFNRTFFGRILFRAVTGVARKQEKKAKRMPDGAEKENLLKGALFLKHILESNSLRSLSMSAGPSLPYNTAEGMTALANGRIFQGLKAFLTIIRVPKLPKEEN